MTLTATPALPGLIQLSESVVRLEGGTGFLLNTKGRRVIVTARHVVDGRERVRARWMNGSAEVEVLFRDPIADVAIVADRPAMPGNGVALVEPERSVHVGCGVWSAGFPIGWEDPTPVLMSGILAGVGMQTWIAVAGTWGASGSPVAVLDGDECRIVGVLVGAGSTIDPDLRDLGRSLKDTSDKVIQIAGGSEMLTDGPGIGLRGLANFVTARLEALSKQVETHFRSGFVRIEDQSAIRAALG